MSSSGKRKGEEVRASDNDDESETHAPPKKVAKPADETEDIFICNLDKNRRVFVRNCNGRIWIAIRQFFVKDGITLPCNSKHGKFFYMPILVCFLWIIMLTRFLMSAIFCRYLSKPGTVERSSEP
ncbi:RNA polymerase II transcriptional coactivator KIWI isoform X2 [Arabidopsis lyrata subsp. lyrata]|uniref:RNA polymerase II transcriptional coactivator KIWI isoform X2 n=1 Tax=Arabidopsis lyrata subsp. lyrata TaxID=81972 RepID=UPI000A29A99D|nr:RNA polymerase II transcriptional coactivator KIWI isoform X2 [Arabidopsis lyrata subsp. lyrata]|eukprot:XP_020877311.1 RNA polymerase II transcriptional coactivator KIWI isoform X2 [Arabidopsis lyrata subsp. lyrata]